MFPDRTGEPSAKDLSRNIDKIPAQQIRKAMFFMVISLSLCKAQAKVRAIYTRLSQLSIRTAMLRPCRKRHAPEPGRITEAFSFFNEVVIGGAMNTGFAIRKVLAAETIRLSSGLIQYP
ncbi:hypothetical protein [uncultured Akkermansia sp.]|uniref:hypothetical protein n=1 Tax=uncultured Akkermansia sp. TaxID=512294 RepID=UPI00259AF268|nr:hypothetical protein [uncultured Akkermansia sp.]